MLPPTCRREAHDDTDVGGRRVPRSRESANRTATGVRPSRCVDDPDYMVRSKRGPSSPTRRSAHVMIGGRRPFTAGSPGSGGSGSTGPTRRTSAAPGRASSPPRPPPAGRRPGSGGRARMKGVTSSSEAVRSGGARSWPGRCPAGSPSKLSVEVEVISSRERPLSVRDLLTGPWLPPARWVAGR